METKKKDIGSEYAEKLHELLLKAEGREVGFYGIGFQKEIIKAYKSIYGIDLEFVPSVDNPKLLIIKTK